MAEPDTKDAFGYANGTIFTTPELTAEEEEDSGWSVESGRSKAA
ncbi:hypothetical protein [Lentzea tibetensis]|nr:hypothetical protein [Lentzea tibetensis]